MEEKKSENNPKEYWKLLEKFSQKNHNDSGNISSQKFYNHFKFLLFSEHSGNTPPESLENGPLDFSFETEELMNSIKSIKPGKAVGMDNIYNEMLVSLCENHPNIVIKLFNLILQSSDIPEQWGIGVIVKI